jgi:hypothetical protein
VRTGVRKVGKVGKPIGEGERNLNRTVGTKESEIHGNRQEM